MLLLRGMDEWLFGVVSKRRRGVQLCDLLVVVQ